ncbi:phosphatidylserine/phosphatidylglycerophosphate/cardiolipin synthase family protein [Euzebya sp.]|uniref:phospholipase D-like domain-containing protein n=1 Tax=Euzebya sp. TaxID=1971409 RepID=UPI0035120986
MPETTTPETTTPTATHRQVLEAITGIPATEGNRVDVLRNGVEIFPAMLEAIRSAERSIDLMTFIYWTGDISDAFADALAERARAGVRVRVLVDGFGARTMAAGARSRMRDAGVVLETFRPFSSLKVWRWNVRTHRRVLVVDSTVAFTGGVGIAAEWEGDADDPTCWRDTHYRVEGPAVDGIHAAFRSDWIETPHALVDESDEFGVREPAGTSAVQVIRASSQPGWNDSALALHALLTVAVDRIRVTSAYFRPPAFFLDLLCHAPGRGVDVEVLVPGPHTEPVHYRWAAEHHYARLLDHGVRIHAYEPTMLHAKVVTVDRRVAFVGTTNVDARSLALNEQIGLLVHDPDVVATLDAHFVDDRAHSRTLDAATWRDRPLTHRLRSAATHLATFGLRGSGAAEQGRFLD